MAGRPGSRARHRSQRLANLLRKPVPLPSALALSGVTVAIVAILPVVYVVVMAGRVGPTEALRVLGNPHIRVRFATTVGLAGAVAVSSSAVGLGLAWLVTRTDLPGRRWLHAVLCLPAVLPSYLVRA